MGHSKGHLWTADEDRLILDYLARGWSARQISLEVGASRNAVIGRILRAKTLRDHGFAYKAGEQLRTRIETRMNRICDEIAAALPQHGKVLLHLKQGECKWPVAYDPEVTGHYWFCAKHIRPDENYCAAHRKLAAGATPLKRIKL